MAKSSAVTKLEILASKELSALQDEYSSPPEHAKTKKELLEAFPNIPKGRLDNWLANKVAAGEWRKRRIGEHVYYWPVED